MRYKHKNLIKTLYRNFLKHYHYYGIPNNGRMLYNFAREPITKKKQQEKLYTVYLKYIKLPHKKFMRILSESNY